MKSAELVRVADHEVLRAFRRRRKLGVGHDHGMRDDIKSAAVSGDHNVDNFVQRQYTSNVMNVGQERS